MSVLVIMFLLFQRSLPQRARAFQVGTGTTSSTYFSSIRVVKSERRRETRKSPCAIDTYRQKCMLLAPLYSSTLRSFSSSMIGSIVAKGDVPDNIIPATSTTLYLSTVTLPDLEAFVKESGYPKYRAKQIYHWIRTQGITNVHDMTNLPSSLKDRLEQSSRPAALTLVKEQVSRKDGTIKRAYRLHDGYVIESVLMRYADGRYTACISSQAGCAQACTFCATGQMGFGRQLTSCEIFEQVFHFAAFLHQQPEVQQQQKQTHLHVNNQSGKSKKKRLSNIVFMGMGEPLANYRNVIPAIRRIMEDVGIGARKITLSTVGIVPNIRKLFTDPQVPPIKLAVSLHAATDDERSRLIPVNRRYGGLEELMTTLRDYIETTSRRISLEWALIDGENDTPDVARQLGRLVQKHNIRKDMVHVNVIPLNPTGGYHGSPSQRQRVNTFCKILTDDFGIACTPRVRRGIDIDAGCGQLTSAILQKEK